MNGRKWDSKTKAMIVLAGLKGKSVSEICEEYQIRQSQYYKWRDQFLSGLPHVFETENKREKSYSERTVVSRRLLASLR